MAGENEGQEQLQPGEEDFGGAFDEEGKQAGVQGDQGAAEGGEQKSDDQAGGEQGGGEPDEEAVLAEFKTKHPKIFEKYETQLTELNKKLEEAVKTTQRPVQEQTAQREEADPFAEAPEELKAFLTEYPEVKTVAEMMAKHQLQAMFGGDPKETLGKFAETVGQMQFEQALANGFVDDKGTFIEGHPDYRQIVLGPHKELYDGYLKDNKIDPNKISNPAEAIRVLSDFKEKSLKPFLAKTAQGQRERTAEGEEMMRQAGASLGSARGSRGAMETKGKSGGKAADQTDDFEGAFSEA